MMSVGPCSRSAQTPALAAAPPPAASSPDATGRKRQVTRPRTTSFIQNRQQNRLPIPSLPSLMREKLGRELWRCAGPAGSAGGADAETETGGCCDRLPGRGGGVAGCLQAGSVPSAGRASRLAAESRGFQHGFAPICLCRQRGRQIPAGGRAICGSAAETGACTFSRKGAIGKSFL